jgi:uncharacterized membrane protein
VGSTSNDNHSCYNNHMHYVLVYLVAAVVFVAIDLVWLGAVAKDFYATQLKGLLSPRPNLPAAFIFYALFVVGLLVFAVGPGVMAHSGLADWWRGTLYGFFTYATYDLTNLATLRNWPLKLTIVDLIWGTTLATMVTLVTLTIFAH